MDDLQRQHKELINKATNDPQLSQFIQPNKPKKKKRLSNHDHSNTLIFQNSTSSLIKKKKTNKYLTKSRSTASLLPAINPSPSTSALPQPKKWSCTSNKMRKSQFDHVLKLQKFVKYKAKKRSLNKSLSTTILLSDNNKQNIDRSLSWNKHLRLLEEYDYNRVILQELCSKIAFSNKDSGNLLSSLIVRNNAIIENVSSALGFERNRIDSITKSNKTLSASKVSLHGELESMKSKFDNIKHQISSFNASQNKHNKQLKLAQQIATDSKLKLHDKEYKSHIIHLEYKQDQRALLDTIKILQTELSANKESLAAFKGYDILQLFADERESNIILITNLSMNIKMDKIKSWFGTIKFNRISQLFSQRKFHFDANPKLLSYAMFVEFNSVDDAKFILELLSDRKIDQATEALKVYFAKEYPSKYVSVRSEFSKEQLLRLYHRFGTVENITLCGQSYIIRFENESQAASAVLNTHGRRMTLIQDAVTDNKDGGNLDKCMSVIDAVFANDIENIQFDDDEPKLFTLSKEAEHRIFALESNLDQIENILAVEWTPPEPEMKKQQRLKLQKQYEPPHMSLIERYNQMIQDVKDRIKRADEEITILKQVAVDKAALKHLRKYIDPKERSVEELKNEIDSKNMEAKKLQTIVGNWKAKCIAFDAELEKSKSNLMELRIRYQTLKRMKCSRMRKMQNAKTRRNSQTISFSDTEVDIASENGDDGDLLVQIEELETKLMLANEKILSFKAGNLSPKTKQFMTKTLVDGNENMEEQEIQIKLLNEELESKNAEMLIIKNQLKDALLRLDESGEQIEDLKKVQIEQSEQIKTMETAAKEAEEKAKIEPDAADDDKDGLVERLNEEIRAFKNEISDLNEELKENKKQIKEFQSILDNGEDGSSSGNSMLQQYMDENESLKKELRTNQRELKNAMIDIKTLEQNAGVIPKGTRRATIHTNSRKPLIQIDELSDSASSIHGDGNDQNEEVTKLKQEIKKSKAQITKLKKTNGQNETVLSLKTVEIRQLKKEMTELKQAKELCETLHIFAEEEEEEVITDTAADAPKKQNKKEVIDGTSSSGTGKTTSRSMNKSGNTTSRTTKRPPIMSAKQQKMIADMIKSRDGAEQKASKFKERVIVLERSNKKLTKNIKSLNSEIDNIKNNKDDIKTMSSDSPQSSSNNHEIDTISEDSPKEKDTIQKMPPPPKRNANAVASKARRASCFPLQQRGQNKGVNLLAAAKQSNTERSANSSRSMYSPISEVPVSELSMEDLQQQIKKLRKELAMWRNLDRNDGIKETHRVLNRTASAGPHKPLMVNKPKLKQPKSKHKVEKKWKMTKSRFLQITKGQHTKRSVKSKRWLLKTINEIFDSKYKSDKNCLRENRQILPLPEFIYHEYIPSRFGIKNLVDAMCWDIHNGVQHHSVSIKNDSDANSQKVEKEEFKEIITFKKFLEEDLSLNDLSFYLKARKVLTESKSLLLDDGFIPFKCINVLLDNIFDGTFKEYRLNISLKLQSLSLLHNDDNAIHKDRFLDFILKENQYLLHEFESSIQALYFHFNLNNQDILKNDDTTKALQFILKGVPTKSIDDIVSVIQNYNKHNVGCSDDMDSDESTNGPDKFVLIKPYMQFTNICKNLFMWKQQFFLPHFSYNANIQSLNFHIMRSVSMRWNEFKDNMIVPILEMFEKHSNAYYVMNGVGGGNQMQHKNNNNKDLLAITKIICRIRDYFEDIDRLISLSMGWDVFILYTQILSSLIQGFEVLDQYELKRLISKQDINQMQCTKAVDNYLYLYEDYVMKRLKRAVATKRTGAAHMPSLPNNGTVCSEYIHLNQQILQK